ncbi:hypothetical protein DXG01_012633 [Tephrocybe rancida]|nr:hypothetical protein DXG01_012633 [Tephrocybe rancida]
MPLLHLTPDYLHKRLIFKDKAHCVDLDLLDEHRMLIQHGTLSLKPGHGTLALALLFDNYLVFTHPTKYTVLLRPMSLDLLKVPSETEQAQRNQGSLTAEHTDNTATSLFPFALEYFGRHGDKDFIIYAINADERNTWLDKIQYALWLRFSLRPDGSVVEFKTLLRPPATPSPFQADFAPNAFLGDDCFYNGNITCSFSLMLGSGHSCVVFGCPDGLWLGFRGEAKSFRRILNRKQVKKCVVLEDLNLLLVLAGKVLYTYHFELNAVAHLPEPQVPCALRELDQKNGILSVQLSDIDGHVFVIYTKKATGSSETTVHVVEPIATKLSELASVSGLLRGYLPIQPAVRWYHKYKKFSIALQGLDVVLLQQEERIYAVVNSPMNMVMIDLFGCLDNVTVPRLNYAPIELVQRVAADSPIAFVHASDSSILLIYKEFGVYVDRDFQITLESRLVEWEGAADRAAFTGKPYFLLFDKAFIEVRDITSGRLCSIVPSVNSQCVGDGLETQAGVRKRVQGSPHILLGLNGDSERDLVEVIPVAASYPARSDDRELEDN